MSRAQTCCHRPHRRGKKNRNSKWVLFVWALLGMFKKKLWRWPSPRRHREKTTDGLAAAAQTNAIFWSKANARKHATASRERKAFFGQVWGLNSSLRQSHETTQRLARDTKNGAAVGRRHKCWCGWWSSLLLLLLSLLFVLFVPSSCIYCKISIGMPSFLAVLRGVFLNACVFLLHGRSSGQRLPLHRQGVDLMLLCFFLTCFSLSLLARWTTWTSPFSRCGWNVVRQVLTRFSYWLAGQVDNLFLHLQGVDPMLYCC